MNSQFNEFKTSYVSIWYDKTYQNSNEEANPKYKGNMSFLGMPNISGCLFYEYDNMRDKNLTGYHYQL